MANDGNFNTFLGVGGVSRSMACQCAFLWLRLQHQPPFLVWLLLATSRTSVGEPALIPAGREGGTYREKARDET